MRDRRRFWLRPDWLDGAAWSPFSAYSMPYDKFPLGQIFDKGISIHCGQAPVQAYIDELIGSAFAARQQHFSKRSGPVELDTVVNASPPSGQNSPVERRKFTVPRMGRGPNSSSDASLVSLTDRSSAFFWTRLRMPSG